VQTRAADLVIGVLATRRLVRLIVEDEVTHPLRVKASKIHPAVEYLVSCQACSSVWAAAAVTLSPAPVRWALAASEGAIITGGLSKMVERVGL
jgi:hypothetical protein